MATLFFDDFLGDTIDPTQWATAYLSGARTNNDEDEFYLDANVTCVDSICSLTAESVPAGFAGPDQNGNPQTWQYSSGIICSTPFTFSYGTVTWSAKVPKGAGLWPALWMVTRNPLGAPEVDIVEVKGTDPTTIYSTYIWAYGNPPAVPRSQIQQQLTTVDLSKEFHTYQVTVTPTLITWALDGVDYMTVPGTAAPLPGSPMCLIADLAVGGTFAGGTPPSNAIFPATFALDWVKVETESSPVSNAANVPTDITTVEADEAVVRGDIIAIDSITADTAKAKADAISAARIGADEAQTAADTLTLAGDVGAEETAEAADVAALAAAEADLKSHGLS